MFYCVDIAPFFIYIHSWTFTFLSFLAIRVTFSFTLVEQIGDLLNDSSICEMANKLLNFIHLVHQTSFYQFNHDELN